jgi:hypothetical protein
LLIAGSCLFRRLTVSGLRRSPSFGPLEGAAHFALLLLVGIEASEFGSRHGLGKGRIRADAT